MNSYQRENWKKIRRNKTLFLTKFISLFFLPLAVLVTIVLIDGIEQLHSEFGQASFLDIGVFACIPVFWLYVGYLNGKSVWETWEREYSGEKAFVTVIRDVSKQATGATNSPYKEIFAFLSSLIFALSPPILLLVLLTKGLEIYFPDVRFDISDYRSVLSFALFGFTIVTIFMIGGYIGAILWILILRPFYSYEEITNFISLSYSNNSRLEKTLNKSIIKATNFIYQRNGK